MESNARRSSCGLTGVLLLGFVVDGACHVAAVDAAFERSIFGLALIAVVLQAKLLASAIRCAATGARVVYVPFPEAQPLTSFFMIVSAFHCASSTSYASPSILCTDTPHAHFRWLKMTGQVGTTRAYPGLPTSSMRLMYLARFLQWMRRCCCCQN